jgi:hypothetical protein
MPVVLVTILYHLLKFWQLHVRTLMLSDTYSAIKFLYIVLEMYLFIIINIAQVFYFVKSKVNCFFEVSLLIRTHLTVLMLPIVRAATWWKRKELDALYLMIYEIPVTMLLFWSKESIKFLSKLR